MQARIAVWAEISRLLRDARVDLPSNTGEAPPGLLAGTLSEFEEFLAHNELELAWDALAKVAERPRCSSVSLAKNGAGSQVDAAFRQGRASREA